MVLVPVILVGLLAAWTLRHLFPHAQRPRVLRRAQRGRGTLDVVVVVDGDSQGARPALLRPGADVGRRMIMRVLPEDSHRDDVQVAARELCRYADTAGAPAAGAVLFVGASEAAVRHFAVGDDYDLVVHLGPDTGRAHIRDKLHDRRGDA